MIVLASRSAVRVKLLRDAGVTFEIDAADLDEDALVQEIRDPALQALTLAKAKALHVARRYPGRFVLGGDQVGVALGDGGDADVNLEKPRSPAHHLALLMSMSGRSHRFHPAAALVKDDVVIASVNDVVNVAFWPFSDQVARQYIATGEGQGSCGGYEIENRGAQLVRAVDGSLQAVLGFPLLLLLRVLRTHCGSEAGLLG